MITGVEAHVQAIMTRGVLSDESGKIITVSTANFNLVRGTGKKPELKLSSDQSAAIAHRGSPIVIHGGPGTGKTTVLVEAALARIQEGQNPDSILLLTYGRERASELRDAIALRTTKTMFEPLARTFHSLAFSIL